jgi:hypothetical protein
VFFSVVAEQRRPTRSSVSKAQKQLQKHRKCLEEFMKKNLVRVPSNGLKYSDRDLKILKMIQGLGNRQLLKIQEELQKFLNWC